MPLCRSKASATVMSLGVSSLFALERPVGRQLEDFTSLEHEEHLQEVVRQGARQSLDSYLTTVAWHQGVASMQHRLEKELRHEHRDDLRVGQNQMHNGFSITKFDELSLSA